MPWRWAFDLVTSVSCRLGRERGELEGKAHDPLATRAGEDRGSVPTSWGRPRCTRPPAPAYSPSVFSRTTTQSRSAGPGVARSGEVDARQQARRADVGVLVEALADREPQPPERDIVRDAGAPTAPK